MRVSPRRLAPLLIALALLVGACTDAGELGGPGIGGTLAAKIGEAEFTNADLQDETELWASNPEFLRNIGVTNLGTEGRRTTELTSFVLSHRIVSEQAAQMSAATGYVPSQDEIDGIITQVDQGFGPSFALFSESFRQQLGRDLAYQNNLQSVMISTEAPPVEVNPRYGDAQVLQGGIVQVTPPSGPVPEFGLQP